MSLIPQLRYTEEGVIAPTPQELQEGLWRVMRKAFGDNINTQASTPQGQMVTSFSAEISDMQNKIIELMNLVDPQFSYGTMQDGIGEIYFLKRKKATKSVVQLTFRGLTGVVVPSGFLAMDIDGNQWRTNESKFIAKNGTILINAESVGTGAIEAEAGSINSIVNSLDNIDSVTNNTPAIAGRDIESREDFEERRKESVAKNSRGMNGSVLGEVFDLDNVIDCFVVDNPTDKSITTGATKYPMIRNSLAVSVVGGNDKDIARAILIKGGTACSFVGNTDIEYLDHENYPEMPPKYSVKFIRPTHIPVYFTVEVDNFDAIGYEQEQWIKSNIINAFRSGKLRARIGRRLVANRYMCRISDIHNNVIMGIYIGLKAGQKDGVIDFGVDQFPVLSELNIKITEFSDD